MAGPLNANRRYGNHTLQSGATAMRRFVFWTAALLLAAMSAAAAQSTQIADIRVQLLYDYSGTLSVDLTKERNLALWNTVISGGSLKEPASDVLVTVVLLGVKETFDEKANVVVTVFDDDKKRKIAERKFDGVLYGENARAVKALFLPDRTCTPLRIVARNARSNRSVTVPFRCGE